MRLLVLILILCCSAPVASAYQEFPVVMVPMAHYPDLAAEWHSLQLKQQVQPLTEAELKRQLDIAEILVAKESDWTDIQWMAAKAAFEYGSFFQKPSDLSYARSIFMRGQKPVERCLKLQPSHVICKLYLGAVIGKIASIDGIFASIRKAKQVEQLWLDITHSQYNFKFSADVSLQGSARYALGIFYRLVPDLAFVKWMFDVRGDIEKSIAMHRDALIVDRPNTCTQMMLGVALLCGAKADEGRRQEGLQQLNEAKKLPHSETRAQVCWNDIDTIIADPSKACGYEESRQQDTSESAAEKLKP